MGIRCSRSNDLRRAGDDNGVPGRDRVGVRDAVHGGDDVGGGTEVGSDLVEGIALDDPVPTAAGVGSVASAVALGLVGSHGDGREGDNEDRGGVHFGVGFTGW